MLKQQECQNIENPQNIAKIFKYYLQFKNPYLKFVLPLNKISAKSMFEDHKNIFLLMHFISVKYHLDIHKYLKFFINILDKREKDVNELISIEVIVKYTEWLKFSEQQIKIYKYFMKSVKNIAHDCMQLGFYTTKDFIRYVISKKKLSEYLVSGKISLYYFAAIPNFKKIISKLDIISKAEFQKLFDRFEMYNNEITTAYIKITNKKINPIKITDDAIYKLRNSITV